MQPLHISLNEQTTRRRPWWVVWILGSGITALTCILIIFQSILALDTTSTIQPANTILSTNIKLTAKNRRILHNKIGNLQVFAGAPWVFDDVFKWANDEITIFIDKNGNYSVSIDQPIPNDVKSSFQTYKLNAITGSHKNTTLLSKSDEIFEQKAKLYFALLNPWNNAIIIESDSKKTLPVHFSENRISIRGIGLAQEMNTVNMPSSTEILVQMYYPNGYLPGINDDLSIINELFQENIVNSDTFLTLGMDGDDFIYHILLKNSDLSLDDLSLIGNEIINRRTLSTTAWTINNAITVQELVVDQSAITKTLNNEQGISILTFANQKGDFLRITKSDNVIAITNRESLLNSANKRFSTCAKTQNYIKPNAIVRELQATQNISFLSLNTLSIFQEIAFKRNSIKMCWN